MISKLVLRNFKGFESYTVDFQRLNLLVGGNNSGKTTLFHALQLAFWCIEQTADVDTRGAAFRKTQVSEVSVVPTFNSKDLFYRQQLQAAKKAVRLRIEVESSEGAALGFDIYRAFSRNLMVDGADQTLELSQYESLMRMKPVYIPGTIGITVREEYLRAVSQQRLIAEGRQNQVLRNLVYRLKESNQWEEFTELVRPLFALEGLGVPFDTDKDEWLTATYEEDGCEFDFVSAGSGFLQAINLLCFLFLNESRTALLDEPDSHMHDDLQRVMFDVLDRLSRQKNLQLIIATHSATLVDVAGLNAVLLVDRTQERPLQACNVDALVPLLGDRGLSLPPTKVLDTLRMRRALFVEGVEADYERFILELGEVALPGFRVRTRGLKVFSIGGARRAWPFEAVDCFQQLLGQPLQYVYVSDRDFMTDEEVLGRSQRAANEGRPLVHLERRHRESYLLQPSVLARVLAETWARKRPDEALPEPMGEGSIQEFILAFARSHEDKAQTDFLVANDMRGSQEERAAATAKLVTYFRQHYSEPLARNEVPWRLLDAKAALREFRRKMNDEHKVSFSDVDVCRATKQHEIPVSLRELLSQVRNLFPDGVGVQETLKFSSRTQRNASE